MNILVTGGTGFIGALLLPALVAAGHEVTVLSRSARSGPDGCRYINDLQQLDNGAAVDAIVNLAGASLAARRWTARYKQEIVDSRLKTTRQLVALCKNLDTPPAALLSASAIGYYGHHGDKLLAEDASQTPGFAQRLCSDWEEAALAAEPLGTRVCLLRLGVVLDAGGGALAQMAQSFRFGVGSWLGSGEQWLSWIHRADAVRAVLFLLEHATLRGPFNLTAPEPVTARYFCAALAERHRTLFSAGVPAPLARLLLGEMADELLLNGQRVVPAALQAAGFQFGHAHIEDALAAIYAN